MPLVRLDVYSLPDPLLPSASLGAAVVVSATVTAAFTAVSPKLALEQQSPVSFPGPPQEAAGDGGDVFELLVVDGAGRLYLRASYVGSGGFNFSVLQKSTESLVLKRAPRLLKRFSPE